MAFGPAGRRRADLPARLGDQEFWKLMSDFSEPNGNFRSDNLVSNEIRYQDVIPQLVRTAKPGGVYSASAPSRTSPMLRRCGRGSRSSSTSGGATSICT